MRCAPETNFFKKKVIPKKYVDERVDQSVNQWTDLVWNDKAHGANVNDWRIWPEDKWILCTHLATCTFEMTAESKATKSSIKTEKQTSGGRDELKGPCESRATRPGPRAPVTLRFQRPHRGERPKRPSTGRRLRRNTMTHGDAEADLGSADIYSEIE